jgi:hypothetical protein
MMRTSTTGRFVAGGTNEVVTLRTEPAGWTGPRQSTTVDSSGMPIPRSMSSVGMPGKSWTPSKIGWPSVAAASESSAVADWRMLRYWPAWAFAMGMMATERMRYGLPMTGLTRVSWFGLLPGVSVVKWKVSTRVCNGANGSPDGPVATGGKVGGTPPGTVPPAVPGLGYAGAPSVGRARI